MEHRLQMIGDDFVLEITETKPSKQRLSEKQLLAQQEYLVTAIAKFEADLEAVKAKLALIANAKHEKDRK